MSILPGQRSLENFYVSLQFQDPARALIMADDIRTVALYSLSDNHETACDAVYRLRQRALGLPPVLSRVLDHALVDLGYDLDVLYDV